MIPRIVLTIIAIAFIGYFISLFVSVVHCNSLPQYESMGGNNFGLIAKRDPCLAKIAARYHIKAICDYAFKKESCLSDYSQQAGSISECRNLPDVVSQDYCIRNIAVVQEQNPDICLYISDDISADYCLKDLLSDQTDTSYCNKFRIKEGSAFYAECMAKAVENSK